MVIVLLLVLYYFVNRNNSINLAARLPADFEVDTQINSFSTPWGAQADQLFKRLLHAPAIHLRIDVPRLPGG
jgi:hypothetical protein